MTDCLLLNSLLRSVRNARSARSDPKKSSNGIGAASTALPRPSTSAAGDGTEWAAKRPPVPPMSSSPSTRVPAANADAKSEDGAAFLPGLLGDFRSDLIQLQDTVRRDLEELETLRLQNAVLREQLAERDRIIASLQRQLRADNG